MSRFERLFYNNLIEDKEFYSPMCLIACAFRQHPEYPLILVANRDEFYDRPTRAADFWPEQPDILAGRDLRMGGTWLGISRSGGRLAAVTNYREGRQDQPAPRSRGELPCRFLTSDIAPEEFVSGLDKENDNFAGYNLLVSDGKTMAYGTNRGQSCPRLDPGCYALSNHLLNTPWPKVSAAREAMQKLVIKDILVPQEIMALLSSRDVYPRQHLPHTGISPKWEQVLSAAFVVSEDYGTRSTTLILVNANGKVTFVEQSYLRGKPVGAARHFQFTSAWPDGTID